MGTPEGYHVYEKWFRTDIQSRKAQNHGTSMERKKVKKFGIRVSRMLFYSLSYILAAYIKLNKHVCSFARLYQRKAQFTLPKIETLHIKTQTPDVYTTIHNNQVVNGRTSLHAPAFAGIFYAIGHAFVVAARREKTL
jgi:hypothetical protein